MRLANNGIVVIAVVVLVTVTNNNNNNYDNLYGAVTRPYRLVIVKVGSDGSGSGGSDSDVGSESGNSRTRKKTMPPSSQMKNSNSLLFINTSNYS